MAKLLESGELRARLQRDVPEALAEPYVPAHAAEPAGERRGEEQPHPVIQEHDAVVRAEHLPAVARYLRDMLGYSYLSHLTAVDYLHEGFIEVLYYFYHPQGGGPQIVRVRVPRDNSVIPSIAPFWPGANLQEREAYDLYGVHFPGHPFHRRVYLWDEFEGHPMRKDFPKTGDKYTHVTGGEE